MLYDETRTVDAETDDIFDPLPARYGSELSEPPADEWDAVLQQSPFIRVNGEPWQAPEWYRRDATRFQIELPPGDVVTFCHRTDDGRESAVIARGAAATAAVDADQDPEEFISDLEIVLTDAGYLVEWAEPGTISDINGDKANTPKPDDWPITNASVHHDDDGEKIVDPLSMSEILANINARTKGWPRRVGDALFIHDANVSWLNSADSLFGWLGSVTGTPTEFHRSPKCHTPAHVYHELRRTSQSYTAIETLPHEPQIAGHYYTSATPEPGNGEALRQLVERYSPETPIDGDLIAAMFATTIWGGAPGTRPAHLITSDAGRGMGKTTLASHVAYFAGGAIELSANEDAAVIKQRLLSPDGLTKRVALLDNVKTMRFSWAELESLITAPTISGKRLYVGEAQRPNNLLWTITLNGASLAKDLAQRCVIIKLGKPKRSGTWAEDTIRFIDLHRTDIIADCVALLRSERYPVATYTRWAAWERDVLERLPEPSDAQATIRDRQSVADVEDEEAGIIQEHFANRLRALGYDAKGDRVFIPSGVVAAWYSEATREKASTTSVSRRLNQSINEGTVTLLQPNRCNTYGRGFVYVGPACQPSTDTLTDIESRIVHYQPKGA